MRKNDKPDLLYHTPLNKFRGEPASPGPRLCVCMSHSYSVRCLCLSVCFHWVCVLARLCLVSLRKGSLRVNRVEINKDESSIFSLSDRWFTQKQLWSVIERPQEMQQTKQCLTPVSCSHVWNSIHMLLLEVTFYLQFTLTFHTSISYFIFSQCPVLSSCMVYRE